MHVFWTWAPFFWTCTCFLDLTGIFFGPRVTKNVGDLLVFFLDPVGIFFLDLHVFVLDPGEIFSTAKLYNCFWARFLFFGPVRLLRGPCLHRVGGKLHCCRRSHWAGCFLDLGAFFFGTRTRFFGPGTGWGEFRYWDKMHARSCWCRPGKFQHWNNKNVRNGGEANGGSLCMKRNGRRKLTGT